MSWHLRSYDINPPGGYPYTQTGYPPFPSQPLIEAQAQIVSAFRRANNLPRSSLAETLSDIDFFQCQRLGFMPTYCINTDPSDPTPVPTAVIVAPGTPPPCKGCGIVIK